MRKSVSKISQNSQENTCVRLRPATLLKKETLDRCFAVNFAKFLRTSFFTERLRVIASGIKYMNVSLLKKFRCFFFCFFFVFFPPQILKLFKACVRYFLTNFYFSPNDSPSKTMEDVFYFI